MEKLSELALEAIRIKESSCNFVPEILWNDYSFVYKALLINGKYL